MARTFTFLNFGLLLLLGSVCVFQWYREKDYGARITDLQRTAGTQENKLAQQTEDLRRVNEDLDGFKQNVATLKTQTDEQVAAIRAQKAQIFTLEGEKDRLSKQLVNWQHALEEHKAAVAARDQNIQTLLAQREQILSANKDTAEKANQAILAYNELATKYDDVVKRYNTLATQYKAEHDAAAATAK